MQQADDVSSYAREDRPRIHGVRSLMSYSSCLCSTFRAVDTLALASSRMHWKCDDRSTDLDSPTCSLLSNNIRAVADSREHAWCILLYLRKIFIATPTGEVSKVEISSMVSPSPIYHRPYSRAPASNGPYSSVSTRFLSVD